MDDEKIFEVAIEQLNASYKAKVEFLEDEIEEPIIDIGLAKSFASAIEKTKSDEIQSGEISPTPTSATKKSDKSGAIDIKSLF